MATRHNEWWLSWQPLFAPFWICQSFPIMNPERSEVQCTSITNAIGLVIGILFCFAYVFANHVLWKAYNCGLSKVAIISVRRPNCTIFVCLVFCIVFPISCLDDAALQHYPALFSKMYVFSKLIPIITNYYNCTTNILSTSMCPDMLSAFRTSRPDVSIGSGTEREGHRHFKILIGRPSQSLPS